MTANVSLCDKHGGLLVRLKRPAYMHFITLHEYMNLFEIFKDDLLFRPNRVRASSLEASFQKLD